MRGTILVVLAICMTSPAAADNVVACYAESKSKRATYLSKDTCTPTNFNKAKQEQDFSMSVASEFDAPDLQTICISWSNAEYAHAGYMALRDHLRVMAHIHQQRTILVRNPPDRESSPSP